MTALLVDWLGRGGIAQSTEAWAIVLREAGVDTTVVTRPNRELGGGSVSVEAPAVGRNRILAHAAVSQHAAALIRERQPDLVVVQNYLLPPLEYPVYRAARQVGARLALVVHDSRLHSRWAGSTGGLWRHLRAADDVICHSHFVADNLKRTGGRSADVVPLPIQLGLLGAPPGDLPFERDLSRRLAVHFGVLHRSYKGSDMVATLAGSLAEWQLALLGVGAPAVPGCVAVGRFLLPGELVASVSASSVTLLPYQFATQSGAVVLAHALGSVPVATAVGGLPEQVENGVDGFLVEANADPAVWLRALAALTESGRCASMARAGQERVQRDHERFQERVTSLASLSRP